MNSPLCRDGQKLPFRKYTHEAMTTFHTKIPLNNAW